MDDEPEKIAVLLERAPTCFWHRACTAMYDPPMKIIEEREDHTLLECTGCRKRARFPVGGFGLEECEVEPK